MECGGRILETQGADIAATIRAFRHAYPGYANTAVVPVSASDALGCLETGFARAVEALIETLVPAQRDGKIKCLRQVNVLVGSMLTPGDIEGIKEWVAAFGLRPVVLPDIGDSLDGHLIAEGYATLTYGGISRQQIARLGESCATLVIGSSLARAADLLKERTGVPDHRFDGIMGLDACDAFTATLAAIAGVAVPAGLERQRSQLQDAMVDCQFQLGGRAAVAADADLLASLVRLFASLGIETVAAVAAAKSDILAHLPVARVTIGDLEDLEVQARDARAQVLVANSHGAQIASRLALPLMRAGFPLYDQAGAHLRQWVGYRGTSQTLFELTNHLAAHYQEIAPYRSNRILLGQAADVGEHPADHRRSGARHPGSPQSGKCGHPSRRGGLGGSGVGCRGELPAQAARRQCPRIPRTLSNRPPLTGSTHHV